MPFALPCTLYLLTSAETVLEFSLTLEQTDHGILDPSVAVDFSSRPPVV